MYFGQDHENNPAAWRVIGYNGNGVASAQGDMTLLAAGNMSQCCNLPISEQTTDMHRVI